MNNNNILENKDDPLYTDINTGKIRNKFLDAMPVSHVRPV